MSGCEEPGAACRAGNPVNSSDSVGRRKVPRPAFAEAQDDIRFAVALKLKALPETAVAGLRLTTGLQSCR